MQTATLYVIFISGNDAIVGWLFHLRHMVKILFVFLDVSSSTYK